MEYDNGKTKGGAYLRFYPLVALMTTRRSETAGTVNAKQRKPSPFSNIAKTFSAGAQISCRRRSGGVLAAA